jgi:Ca2+-transporting ATPase
MFTVLVTAHLLYAFVVRSPEGGTRARLSRLATNRWLIVAVGLGLALQVLVVAIAGLRPVFGTAGLSGGEWALTLGLGVLPVALMFLGVFAGKDEETFRY